MPEYENNETTLHVRQAIDGDQQSRGWIVSRFSPLIRAQARYRLGSTLARKIDLDDVVSEAWLAVLPKMHMINPREGRFTPVLLSYLSSTVRNIANDLLRAYTRRKSVEKVLEDWTETSGGGLMDGVQADVRSVVSLAAQNDLASAVNAALEQLDPQAREVVVLHGIEGLQHRQIAVEMGIKPNTIAQQYHRAILKLRKLIPDSVFHELVDE